MPTMTPKEILTVTQEEWCTSRNGTELVLQDATSRSGDSMTIVHVKHVASNRTFKLLSVVHRPGEPYPVTIDVEADGLQDFLKETYDWVAGTPSEFRSKLANALTLESVKSTILNLSGD